MSKSLLALRYGAEEIAAKRGEIGRQVIAASRVMRLANFERIERGDLARLFALYDTEFFDGRLSQEITAKPGTTLGFRVSPTMTRCGGKTYGRRRRLRTGTAVREYEIAIATRMLFMNFRDRQRPVTVCGLVCADRLSALQRIMEHEILHLAEMLFWGRSSCAQSRFKALSRNIFGHLASKHDLVTSAEKAKEEHGVGIGSAVAFRFDGELLEGFVNRINHRATVLVESRDGAKYRDGKRYRKYYVPLGRLTAKTGG
jgi:hypothetical protein